VTIVAAALTAEIGFILLIFFESYLLHLALVRVRCSFFVKYVENAQ